MTSIYNKGEGVYLTIYGTKAGVTICIPTHWTIAAIGNYIKELQEFLS